MASVCVCVGPYILTCSSLCEFLHQGYASHCSGFPTLLKCCLFQSGASFNGSGQSLVHSASPRLPFGSHTVWNDNRAIWPPATKDTLEYRDTSQVPWLVKTVSLSLGEGGGAIKNLPAFPQGHRTLLFSWAKCGQTADHIFPNAGSWSEVSPRWQ